MVRSLSLTLIAVWSLVFSEPVLAGSSCSNQPTSSVPAPKVSRGYKVHLIANGLQAPRGIIFDSEGHLLVVEQGVGVQALTLDDDGGCVTVKHSKQIVSDSSLNHGIELSKPEGHLYASSSETVYKYNYNHKKAEVTSSGATIITNMTNDDHTTRTLLFSKKKPGTLIVTRGSTSNIDEGAAIKSSGRSQIKAFNLRKRHGRVYDFTHDGKLLGWGLRNDVGIAEEPIHGGIYSVENSADEVSRYGVNFHEGNPAEELNYLGTLLNNKSPHQGSSFGYPECFAAWNVDEIPKHKGITVGSQFSLDPDTISDETCRKTKVAPRLVFRAHMAPLSIMFDDGGSHAWVTFHGSWDRTHPDGYGVAKIAFKNGHPTEPSTSKKAADFIVKNANPSNCPDQCFRPVGLAQDHKGRIFFSSDATGEIYMITFQKKGSLASLSPSLGYTYKRKRNLTKEELIDT